MLALVGAQVNGSDCAFKQLGDALAHCLGRAGEREDRAVMGGVRLDVEYAQARHGAQGVGQRVNNVCATSFADVGDTFDGRHGS